MTMTLTLSYDAYIALMAALRECETRDTGTAAGNRWRRMMKEIRAAAFEEICRELDFAHPPPPLPALLRKQA